MTDKSRIERHKQILERSGTPITEEELKKMALTEEWFDYIDGNLTLWHSGIMPRWYLDEIIDRNELLDSPEFDGATTEERKRDAARLKVQSWILGMQIGRAYDSLDRAAELFERVAHDLRYNESLHNLYDTASFALSSVPDDPSGLDSL